MGLLVYLGFGLPYPNQRACCAVLAGTAGGALAGPAHVPRVRVTLILAKEPAAPCLQGPLAARWLDEADCVGAWEGDALAAAVFPTAESVPVLRMIDGAPPALSALLIVVPSGRHF